jgi:hypothetical protein
VTDLSVQTIIDMVDVTLRSTFLTVASETKLKNSDEVQEAINGLKFSKALGPNGIPNRALKLLQQRAVFSLTQNFKAIILISLQCGSTFE